MVMIMILRDGRNMSGHLHGVKVIRDDKQLLNYLAQESVLLALGMLLGFASNICGEWRKKTCQNIFTVRVQRLHVHTSLPN